MSEPSYAGPFVRESNKIEGIFRDPTTEEILAFENFLELPIVHVHSLQELVHVFQPGAVLRNQRGRDVYVGNHRPPPGGPSIVRELHEILAEVYADDATPYSLHKRYEDLHPFTDGNGRTGRALWAWQMVNYSIPPGLSLGFLHAFYYQTLEFGG